MPKIKETDDHGCVTCEWLAVFLCVPCNQYVCGRHRSAHYAHHVRATQDPHGGKKK